MHIGINGYFWGQETTGSGQYLVHLMEALLSIPQDNLYSLFIPQQAECSLVEPAGPSAPRLRVFYVPFEEGQAWAKILFEQLTFPKACQVIGVELAHVPYFASSLSPSVPTVVTIHDLIPLLLPAYRGDFRVRLYTRLVSRAARRAEAILTDSQASQRDIIQTLRIPEERVHVVYLAAAQRFRPMADRQALAALRARYGLPERYMLYLGGFDQRRNISTLLRALAEIVRDWRESDAHPLPRLVLAGQLPQADTPFSPDPRRMVRELGLEKIVQCIGRVAEEEKPSLYNGARFFVFPSIYEGFGLPPLEAMACGAPVIASNATSLPEIVGEGGFLVDAYDVGGWAQAMVALWTQPERRRALRTQALAQAARFSWAKTARETLQVYQQVARVP